MPCARLNLHGPICIKKVYISKIEYRYSNYFTKHHSNCFLSNLPITSNLQIQIQIMYKYILIQYFINTY